MRVVSGAPAVVVRSTGERLGSHPFPGYGPNAYLVHVSPSVRNERIQLAWTAAFAHSYSNDPDARVAAVWARIASGLRARDTVEGESHRSVHGHWSRYAQSMLPARDIIVGQLDSLRDVGFNSTDERVRLVGVECETGAGVLRRASAAAARDETLAGILYLRILAEIALRVRWLGGTADDVRDATGWPTVDVAQASENTRALRKRDLHQLAAAHRAITTVRPGGPSELTDQAQALADSIDGAMAPPNADQLALSPMARKIYAGHRLASMMIHPGASLGRGDLMSADVLEAMTDEAAIFLAIYAAALMRSFGATIEYRLG